MNSRSGTRPPVPVAAEPDGVAEPHGIDGFWLDAALARLPERERTVVELTYYEDLSERAVARRLRVPVGSVKSWKRRGLNRLALLLGEEAP
jgi:RNA polymerase sigma-70 factor (ECF subfamily)